jgi:hypothetical protein
MEAMIRFPQYYALPETLYHRGFVMGELPLYDPMLKRDYTKWRVDLDFSLDAGENNRAKKILAAIRQTAMLMLAALEESREAVD